MTEPTLQERCTRIREALTHAHKQHYGGPPYGEALADIEAISDIVGKLEGVSRGLIAATDLCLAATAKTQRPPLWVIELADNARAILSGPLNMSERQIPRKTRKAVVALTYILRDPRSSLAARDIARRAFRRQRWSR